MNELTDLAFARIDDINAADPGRDGDQPAALIYGRRMTAQQAALYPDAGAVLRIACRGQHIERWLLPRGDYPEGRAGYLAWRGEQGRRHGARIAAIMRDLGFAQAQADHAAAILRKEGIKRDPDAQALEDVACFTFMRHYMAPFSETRTPAEMARIVDRTARKMSAFARARAITEFALPEDIAVHFRDEPAATPAR
ncbi:MAG: DUF4202 domain-containing protein [Paracoccus sp. (in: a-proteobacteria)]|nr:DUF4202 domain-containing protein [Paracoccus sp. (in: a-proteobacteria)]